MKNQGAALVFLTLAFLGCSFSTLATGKDSIPPVNQITCQGVVYRVVYEKYPQPQKHDAVIASVSVEAVNPVSQQRLWIKQLDGICGNYASWDYQRLGFEMERLKMVKLTHEDTSGLFLRTNQKAVYILDPATGESLLKIEHQRWREIPAATQANMRLAKMELIAIQAVPGYGVNLRVRYQGKAPILVEPFYIPFILEGWNIQNKAWEKIAESNLGEDHLEMVKNPGEFEIFIPAEIFEHLLQANEATFVPLIKRIQAGIEKGPEIVKTIHLKGSLPSRSGYSSYRIGVVYYEMDNTDITPVGIVRNDVPLSVDDVIRLLRQGTNG